MKAMVCRRYGTPDVLRLEDLKIPIPEDDEVLVKIRASSINAWDWDYVRGTPLGRISGGLIKPKHKIFGADVSGEVITAGRKVTRFSAGDEVFGDISGSGWGGFAEYVCARENVLAKKSPNMSFEEAAATPQAGLLALQALTEKGQVQQGENILINGAGGGVGTFAVQLAKSFGAEVTGVDSGEKLDLICSIGADHAIDYTEADYTQSDVHYDRIIDVVVHRSVFDYKRILNTKGNFVMAGGSTFRILQFLLFGPWISKRDNKKMNVMIYKPTEEGLDQLSELFEAGVIIPVIDRNYKLTDVAAAIQYLGDGHVQGKVVVTM